MPIPCADYALLGKRISGWMFAHFFHHCFVDATFVLLREGLDETDIEFSISADWLNANNPRNFGLDSEEITDVLAHLEKCQSAQCVETQKRIELFFSFLAKKDSFTKSVFGVIAACSRRDKDTKERLRRSNKETGEAIDELRVFFDWILGEKEFWTWPK